MLIVSVTRSDGIIPVFMLLKHEIIPEKVLTVRFFVSLQIFKN